VHAQAPTARQLARVLVNACQEASAEEQQPVAACDSNADSPAAAAAAGWLTAVLTKWQSRALPWLTLSGSAPERT